MCVPVFISMGLSGTGCVETSDAVVHSQLCLILNGNRVTKQTKFKSNRFFLEVTLAKIVAKSEFYLTQTWVWQ